MVPKTGIEPVRKYKFRRILSPVRLPVPPLRRKNMAPRVGLEPTAYRLTAGCSTIELPWNNWRRHPDSNWRSRSCSPLPYHLAMSPHMGWIKRFELSVSRATIWRFNQLSYTHHKNWSRWRDSNPRPHGPKPRALPNCATPRDYTIILKFLKWWTIRDSNPGPTGYEPGALTN